MSAAPTSIGQSVPAPKPAPRTPSSHTMAVPAKWRTGQIVVIALITLLAIYYNLKGHIVPAGGEAVPPRTIIDQLAFVLLGVLVWLSTPNAGVIAVTTLQEAVRRRWLLVLLAFGVVVLLFSTSLVGLQPGEEERFLRDFGTGFIITITLLMAIFLGAGLVPPEIERRTIFTILSKPVTRLEFLIGKFLGLALTLFVNLFILGAVYLTVYATFKIHREGYAAATASIENTHTSVWFDVTNMINALLLHFGQLVVMAALALCLSLIVSSITAIVFCFIVYFGGQMSSYWETLGGEGSKQAGPAVPKPVQGVMNVVYYLLPRLDKFDVRTQLVTDSPVGFAYVWKAFSSGLIYVAVLLTVSYLVFSDREF